MVIGHALLIKIEGALFDVLTGQPRAAVATGSFWDYTALPKIVIS
jgi:hypothetical protein